MFNRVVKKIITGEFICEYTDIEAYNYLKNPDTFKEVDQYLSRINIAVSATQNDLAFYGRHVVIDGEVARSIHEVFKQFKTEVRDVIDWLDTVMLALNMDRALVTGESLTFGMLYTPINSSPALSDRLFAFQCLKDIKDENVRGRLAKLLGKLESWGYLQSINRTAESYVVTGKLDYFFQSLQFIKENEKLPLEQKEEIVMNQETWI